MKCPCGSRGRPYISRRRVQPAFTYRHRSLAVAQVQHAQLCRDEVTVRCAAVSSLGDNDLRECVTWLGGSLSVLLCRAARQQAGGVSHGWVVLDL